MIGVFDNVRTRSVGLLVGAVVFVTLGLAVGLFYASSSTVVTVVSYPLHQYSLCERPAVSTRLKRPTE